MNIYFYIPGSFPTLGTGGWGLTIGGSTGLPGPPGKDPCGLDGLGTPCIYGPGIVDPPPPFNQGIGLSDIFTQTDINKTIVKINIKSRFWSIFLRL
jgi:hypothetical protein